MSFAADVDLEALQATLQRLHRDVSPAALQRPMLMASEVVRAELERTTRQMLNRNPTGDLAASWIVSIRIGSNEVVATIRSDRKYAGIHERGDTISAKPGGYLAIPLLGQRQGPRRSGTKLFAIRSRRGNLLLVERVGDGIKPHYLLRKEVKIPARKYISTALRRAGPKAVERIDDHIKRVLRSASA